MPATQTADQTRYIAKCRNGHKSSFLGATPDRYGYGAQRNCKDCDSMTRPKAVKGTYSDKVRCDARCTGSESTKCSCFCEGQMHGADL